VLLALVFLLRGLTVGEPEIHHAHAAIAADHHVVGLEVTVGDALIVRGHQPFARR